MQPENTGLSAIILTSTSLYLLCDCVTYCQYEIGIPAARDIVDDVGNITVPSDVATLTTVFKVEIRHTLGRRKRSFVAEDVNLINSSSTFGLRWNSAKQHEIYTNTCLIEGYAETLQLGISNNLDSGFCNDSYLTITVGAAIPLYIGNTSEVQIDLCSNIGTIVDVLPLTFSNGGDCLKQWNCTVNCTNDGKIFWVGDGLVLQTFIDNVDFVKEYIVEVTCAEKDITTPTISSDNKHMYFINFIESSTSCTTSIMTSLTSSSADTNTNTAPLVPTTFLSGNDVDDVESFFENTGNVAAMSAVGGVVVGGVLGAGLYTIGKKCIAKK